MTIGTIIIGGKFVSAGVVLAMTSYQGHKLCKQGKTTEGATVGGLGILITMLAVL